MASVTTGAVLGERYRLEQMLGGGGMAEVYAATDELLRRPVAVKVLRETVTDPSARARFTTEARTLAQLNHPSVVAVLDASTESHPAYLVLELVEGTSLDRALPGPLPREQVAAIGAEIAGALAHAHAAGVVHRDVKPGNVLLGDDGRARLTDFGIARLLAETAHHTATGFTVGTVAYVAPEQVRGQVVSPATDVYSLGLVLLEALSGQRVFPGTTSETLATRLHAPPPVSETLPERWRDALTHMTRVDPGERPTAEQVAATLTALCTTDASRAQGSERGEPTERTRVITAVSPSPTLPATSTSATPATSPAQSAVAAVVQGWPRSRLVWLVGAAVVALVVGTLVLAAVRNDGGGVAGGGVPDEVPARYEAPLTQLHEAVHGEPR